MVCELADICELVEGVYHIGGCGATTCLHCCTRAPDVCKLAVSMCNLAIGMCKPTPGMWQPGLCTYPTWVDVCAS